jgi:hypothetical protein
VPPIKIVFILIAKDGDTKGDIISSLKDLDL